MSVDLETPRGESELTDAEKVALAESNHIWLNALSCVRPTDDMLLDVGRMVVEALAASPIHGDPMGVRIGKVLYLRVNKS